MILIKNSGHSSLFLLFFYHFSRFTEKIRDANWVKNVPTDEYVNGLVSLKSPSVYIRHPLYSNYQNHILFKLGTIIPEIDKNVYC